MQRLDFFKKGSNIFLPLKLIVGLALGLIVGSAGSMPAAVSAQTEAGSFPGRLIGEGTWERIGPEHELLTLGDNLILEREPAAGQARLWAYDPTVAGADDPLRSFSLAGQAVNAPGPARELLYVGEGRLLNWDPATGRYQVQQVAPAAGQANLLATTPTVRGTFPDIRAGHELIYLGSSKVLAWEPATGQFSVWRYDPALTGIVDSFPGELMVEGVWPAIRTGHELVYLGYNRLLDWEPASGRYRIWRYEPAVEGQANPLGATPVAEGVWTTIQAGHELVSLDNNRFLTWEPATGQFRVWEYALTAIGAFTLEDIAARLAGQTVTGVTIITHGFQLFNDTGDSLTDLATAIHARGGGWLLDYDVADDGANGFFDTCTNDCGPPDIAGQGELVLQFDWAPGSNETSDGWGEAAGEAIFTILVGLGVIDPAAEDNPPLHFIGHSFGTAVTGEAIERLARFDVPVDHVTYLDPHDFDQDSVPVDEDQRLFDLGRPEGYGAAVWDNVIFAEVYYQTRGASGISFPGIDVPNGRPIPGAYNRLLSQGKELPDSGDYPITDTSGDHSYVWTCFYLATVTGSQAMTCPEPETAINFAATGYAFSRIAGGIDQRPDPTFYGADQDHKYSNPQLVDTTSGEPNQTGLMDIGLTAAQVTQGRWAPAWNPLTIMNGDFEHYNDTGVCGATNTCPQPGWAHHGGGGVGHFDAEENNVYLVLDGGVPSNDNHTHNRFYTLPETTGLQFDLRRRLITSGDELEVFLSNELLQSYAIKGDDADYISRQIAIPENLRGRVNTLTFRIRQVGLFIGSEVWIDNVALLEPGEEPVEQHLTYLPMVFKPVVFK